VCDLEGEKSYQLTCFKQGLPYVISKACCFQCIEETQFVVCIALYPCVSVEPGVFPSSDDGI